MPVLACYLSYYGLMFLVLRWWKLSDPTRPKRFSVKAVLACGFWAFILLFLLPTASHRREGLISLVLVASIVQLVSPYQPIRRISCKKLRWRHV